MCSVVDPDPYHLAVSGSVSTDADPDPGRDQILTKTIQIHDEKKILQYYHLFNV